MLIGDSPRMPVTMEKHEKNISLQYKTRMIKNIYLKLANIKEHNFMKSVKGMNSVKQKMI